MMWPQPLAPVHSLIISALLAAIPLVVVLVLMGGLRKSGLFASAWGLLATAILAVGVWKMPVVLAGWSLVYGWLFAAWSILWLVFNALWLYNLTVEAGMFDLLRKWMEKNASGDQCIQAILVAFCFGALLEGSAGFGAPVAITSFLLVGLGFRPRLAVLVALIANTAPVAFGAVGVPIVALAGVTGLDLMKLSAMVGRQLPLLSCVLPGYLAWVVGGRKGFARTWPVALVAGLSFAIAQGLVSNLWGPYPTDVVSSLTAIVCTVFFLRLQKSRKESETGREAESGGETLMAWLPWVTLSLIVVAWTLLHVAPKWQVLWAIPRLHNGVLITLYQKAYAAIFTFQPLGTGTAVLATVLVTAACFRLRPLLLLGCAAKTAKQMRLSAITVLLIVGVAYLYNYSGMAYTLGAALAGVGAIFPFVGSYLGWVACFLTGSDTSSNLLFGNLQVAAAHQLNLNPLLTAATNTTGAVTGKMISPQNISVGVTTVGLVGEEGSVLHSTFWHSVLLAGLIGLLACAQAYVVPRMVP